MNSFVGLFTTKYMDLFKEFELCTKKASISNLLVEKQYFVNTTLKKVLLFVDNEKNIDFGKSFKDSIFSLLKRCNNGKKLLKCTYCKEEVNIITPFLCNVNHTNFLDSNTSENLCQKCLLVFNKIQNIKFETKFELIERDSVVEVNRLRRKRGLEELRLRRKSTFQETPKKSASIFFQEHLKKLKKGNRYETLLKIYQEQSLWYEKHKTNYISCMIELPVLISIIEGNKCLPCFEKGLDVKIKVDREKISAQGVVLRFPTVCQLGHTKVFHCSSFDDNNRYLLNKFEELALSSSGVETPKINMINILRGCKSFEESYLRKKVSSFFRGFGTKELKQSSLKKEREKCIIGKKFLSVDRWIYLFLRSNKKKFKFHVDILEVLKGNHCLLDSYGVICANIFEFLHSRYIIKEWQSDGRWSSVGFIALEATVLMVENTKHIPLYVSNVKKARNNTPKEKMAFDEKKMILETDEYVGASSNLEGIGMRKIMIQMRDEFFLIGGKKFHLRMRTSTADRDGKIVSVYFSVFGVELVSLEYPWDACNFLACFGHVKKTLRSLMSHFAQKKFVEMAIKDFEFALSIYKKSKPYKELERLNKDGIEFERMTVSIIQDIFINALHHHAGKCHCKDVFGFETCDRSTSIQIDTNRPKGKKFFDLALQAYSEFCKLICLCYKKQTTSVSENLNSSLASFVKKRLDYSKTYNERVLFKIISIILQKNFFVQLIDDYELPVCPYTMLQLKKRDDLIYKKKKKFDIRIKTENKLKLKKMHSSGNCGSYYADSKKAKLEEKVKFSDFEDLSDSGMLKSKVPKKIYVKNNNPLVKELKLINDAKRNGETIGCFYICGYCRKSNKKEFKVTESNLYEMVDHMRIEHSSSKIENRKKNIIRELRRIPQKKIK